MADNTNKDIVISEAETDSEYYRVKFNRFSGPQFDGPIDVLVTLVKKSKIDIQDFYVSDITEQYLAYLDTLDVFDLEGAAEFIEIAALLVEMKSKALLPRVQEEPEDSDAEQLKQEIMRRMYSEEYEIYKGASEKMRDLETVGAHYRDPDPAMATPKLVLKDMTKDGLLKALQKLLLKLDQRAKTIVERQIKKDRFTVDEMSQRIKAVIAEREHLSFYDLFEEDFTKTEIITTFQSILELMKGQFIHVVQESTFGEITIHKAA